MTENTPPEVKRSLAKIIAVTAVVAAVLAIGLTALLVNIMERKTEAKNPFYRVVDLTDETDDPEIWGKNFPLQYDSYKRTVDQERTRYGGSEAIQRTPSAADPRSVVSQSKLEEDPRLVAIWKGYAFATDFREERGHAYMLIDQLFTERQSVVTQPGTCIHCHASVYVPYMKAGDGDLIKGFEYYNRQPYKEIQDDFKHPVSCIDCHHPDTMALRITRPGFLEGIRVYKKNIEGIDDYDPNTMASRQELRSYVCGQCHVEYYFKGDEKRLTYPWARGLKADDMLAYYDEVGFKDWTHAETGAPMIKAQHPEFEMWNQGIHARSGVACADCHMPYTRVGSMKVSDHHVRSPLLNVSNACLTCHRWSADEMKQRAETIQDRHFEMRNRAMDALMDLVTDLKIATAGGATDPQLAAARDFQRKATFLVDFIEAENSTGFHAPQESARVLTLALDYSRKGQLALRESVDLEMMASARVGAGN